MSQIIHRSLLAVQRWQLCLLLCVYALAALLPGPGLRIRDVPAGSVPWFHGGSVRLSLPSMMLAFLLLNAGFGTQVQELKHLATRLRCLGFGLAASVLGPILFAFAVSLLLMFWHDEERQNILVGLALIGTMPIAGSSTAWSQNAGGNLSLSLGLVLVSTLGSPLLTPLGLCLVGYMAQGDYAEHLRELASQGSTAILIVTVVAPSLLGLLLQRVLGSRARLAVLPALKLLNLIDLLLLNYANASSALPQAFGHPDWIFLVITFLSTTSVCVLSFGLGRLVAHWARADSTDELSLMFGLGMSNTGTALVLASAALPEHPDVIVPIVFYTLVQQITAGVVDARRRPLAVGVPSERK